MLIITREKAASCTDSELHSLLRVLFNTLADHTHDDPAKRCCHASIQAIKAEQARPGRS